MTAVETFKAHVKSVEALMNFDRSVLEFAIQSIEELQERLTQHHHLENPRLTAERTLQMLRGYRTNDSLRSGYKTIFNQALVLLVSYFGSSIKELFRQGVAEALINDTDSALLKEQIKISFNDLRDANFQLKDIAPDLLIQAKDISFQDMQSIKRAFKDYLGITIEKNQVVHEIILAQGCRHVIVHTGGVVDEKLLRQLSLAKPRELKPVLVLGDVVEFTVDEVSKAAEAMLSYLTSVQESVFKSNGTMLANENSF